MDCELCGRPISSGKVCKSCAHAFVMGITVEE